MDQISHLSHTASSPALLGIGRFDSNKPPSSALANASYRSTQPEKNVDQPEKIRRILESDQRTDYQGQLLYEHIKSFPFFETLNERKTNNYFEKNAFIYLCKKARFEKHSSKEILFKEDDLSNGKMYLVYSGEVSIMSKKQANFYNTADIKRQDLSSKEDLGDNQGTGESLVSKSNTQIIKPEAVITVFKDSDDPQDIKLQGIGTPSKQRTSKIGCLPIINKDNAVKVVANEKETVKIGTDLFRGSRRTIISNRLTISPSPQLSATHGQDEIKHSVRNSSRSSNLQLIRRDNKAFQTSQPFQQPAQEDQLESMSPKTNGALKHKFKAVTRLTLCSIRMNRKNTDNLSGGVSQSPDRSVIIEEAPDHPDFETFLADYGTLVSKVEKGGSFGEKAFFGGQFRSETVITNTDCEFLVINKRDFLYITQNYDSKRKHMMQFMLDFIPDIENISAYELLENLLSTLKEKTYERGSYIIQEGDVGDDLHVLSDGTCEIIKNIRVDDAVNPKEKSNKFKKMLRVGTMQNYQLPVCTIKKGVFVGEETLYNTKNTYDFSVKVTSAYAKVFAISKTDFIEKFPSTTNSEVHQIYNSKVTKYATLIQDLLAMRHPDMKLLHNTYNQKDLEQFLNHEQLLIGPKPKNGLHLETDHSNKSPTSTHDSSPTTIKRQATFLHRKHEESIASQSLELQRNRAMAEPWDIEKVRRNINPFMRKSTQMLSPPNSGLKIPILNVREELGQNRLSPLASDISPINYKRTQDKRGYTILSQQSPIIKPSNSDIETPQDRNRLVELGNFTDSKLDTGATDLNSPITPGELGAHSKLMRRLTQELDARDNFVLEQINEEGSSTCKPQAIK